MKTPLLIILSMFLLWGCAKETPPATVILADFDFLASKEALLSGTAPTKAPGRHYFAKGWDHSKDKCFWTNGSSATVYLTLLGKNCTLAFKTNTHEHWMKKGAFLEVGINGKSAGVFPFVPDSKKSLRTLKVPQTLLKQGLNRIDLTAKLPNQENARGIRFALTSLKVKALLTQKENKRWRGFSELGPGAPGYRLVKPSEYKKLKDPAVLQQKAMTPDQRPDVLMILLDAARRDHFSCYGYPRKTTPELDKIAEKGIVFHRVFAPAPYTLNSVPSILTGLSWKDHGVLKGKDQLPDSLTTLAEILKPAGYFTLAITSNACFSKAYNSHQGFDEFVECWKQPKHEGWNPKDGPEFPEKLFSKRISKGFGPEPVFAYLHLLPPHQPYIPGDAHDLWKDPNYKGTVDGSHKTISDLNRAKRKWNKADQAKLISLYDGNLHRIDASLGRIIDKWKKQNRKRDLLLMVFSDHGEAFGEHKRFSHNSTVYDEMTAVPLVIYPAARWKALEQVKDRFFCLSDLAPLMLNLLNIPLAKDLTLPLRFLDLQHNMDAQRDAVVMINYADLIGIRTEQHLAFYNGLKEQALFDMTKDPEAKHNIRLTHPDLYGSLIGKLRSIMAQESLVKGGARSNLTEADINNLKALGY